MKNYFRILLLLTVFASFQACQNQDDFILKKDPTHTNNESYGKSNIQYEEITFDDYSELEAPETLVSLKSHLDLSTDLKSGDREENLFKIRTDNIKKITKNGYPSYTFMIHDNNIDDNIFENLVILKLESSFKYYRIRYKRNSEGSDISYSSIIKEVDKNSLNIELPVNFLKNGPLDCPIVRCQPCNAGYDYCHSQEEVTWWDGTEGWCSGNDDLIRIYDYSQCDGGNDSDYEDGPYTTGETGSGTGGGGGGPSPSGPTTSPTDPGLEDTSEMDEFNRNRVQALNINISSNQEDFLVENPYTIGELEDFLEQINTLESRNLVSQVVNSLFLGEFSSISEFINMNRTFLDGNSTGDFNNNNEGGYDTTRYTFFDPIQENWPNISNVISDSDFIGWGHPNIRRNCMDYAKAQIAVNSFQISNYFNNAGQTMQIYTQQSGSNSVELAKGISYLKNALQNDIPVIVGIDLKVGTANPNTDNTTDHFVVIVGMGSDSRGKYFTFFDNASSRTSDGANSRNKLYYNSNTGLITGQSQTSYSQTQGFYNYIVTMIRKSKPLNN